MSSTVPLKSTIKAETVPTSQTNLYAVVQWLQMEVRQNTEENSLLAKPVNRPKTVPQFIILRPEEGITVAPIVRQCALPSMKSLYRRQFPKEDTPVRAVEANYFPKSFQLTFSIRRYPCKIFSFSCFLSPYVFFCSFFSPQYTIFGTNLCPAILYRYFLQQEFPSFFLVNGTIFLEAPFPSRSPFYTAFIPYFFQSSCQLLQSGLRAPQEREMLTSCSALRYI